MTAKGRKIPLVLVKAGNPVKIISVPQGKNRAQFIRLGINEGERVICLERLPGGTVVIQKKQQQIALGHRLAKQIIVQMETPETVESDEKKHGVGSSG